MNNIKDFTEGLNYLKSYFDNDISLSIEQKKNLKREIEEARKKSDKLEKAKAIVALMTVRRNDLPQLLQRFGLSNEFLKKYFKIK